MMEVFRRYWNFMLRNKLVAMLMVTSTILLAFIGTQRTMPWYITPTVAFLILFIGSLIVFRKRERQITSKLLSELMDFSNTFHSLTMAGSGENRNIQIRFMFERVKISDRSQKKALQMRGNRIKICHDLIEKWFECYKDEVEYFSKYPKSIDVRNTTRLVNEFEKIVSHYLREFINASIDFINEVEEYPTKAERLRFKGKLAQKFDAFKTKYNHFGNNFNDYIKRLNKELSYQMGGIDIISKNLEL